MASPATSSPKTADLDDAVKQFKLVEALKKDDVTHLDNVISSISTSDDARIPSFGSPLHLAIQVAQGSVIQHLIKKYCIVTPGQSTPVGLKWINEQDSQGETPLHLAAKLGRNDVVDWLMRLPDINDTIPDSSHRLPDEVAKTEEVREVLRRHRDASVKTMNEVLSRHVLSGDTQELIRYFEKPRQQKYIQQGWIDLNAPLDARESSALHIAARRDDTELAEWALKAGADPAVRDKKRRKPIEVCKGTKVAPLLRDAQARLSISVQKTSNTVLEAPPGPDGMPKVVRGALAKWVNYATGYKARYFVLEKGALSYYRTANDYPAACRGSIDLALADIRVDTAGDKCRFSVVPRGGSKAVNSFFLKARSEAEAKKWVWSLNLWKRWRMDHQGPLELPLPAKSFHDDDDVDVDDEMIEGSISDDEAVIPYAESIAESSFSAPVDTLRSVSTTRTVLTIPNVTVEGQEGTTTPQVAPPSPSKSVVSNNDPLTQAMADMSLKKHDYDKMVADLSVQMDSHKRLVESMLGLIPSKNKEFADLLHTSTNNLSSSVAHLANSAKSRETEWKKRWKRERDGRKRWEEMVRRMVEGYEARGGAPSLEVGRPASPDRRSNVSDVGMGRGDAMSTVSEDEWDEEEDIFYEALESAVTQPGTMDRKNSMRVIEQVMGFDSFEATPAALEHRPEAAATLSPKVEAAPVSTAVVKKSSPFISYEQLQQALQGYPPPDVPRRSTFPLDPSVPKPTLNVWSFIKGAIGKDLSKVTLPVFFNEPLSLLQRLSEEMEYCDILSVAGRIGRRVGCKPAASIANNVMDPAERVAKTLGWNMSELEVLDGEDAELLRCLIVGAFAMSNYSSTTGRVNKPFNPMLGETFECVREDMGFRFVAEQVCHHPPISASYCEARDYVFWTEVNVKSKFYGTSLEIHPLGNVHCMLPVYGDAQADMDTRPVVGTEHYSWRKVTTCVRNLIYGKMWLDHYGDMLIKNHRTGLTCTLTFKPGQGPSKSGWFGGGSSSGNKLEPGNAEIVGNIRSKKTGRTRFEIKGRWDDRLIVTPIASGASEPGKVTPLLTKPFNLWIKNPPPVDPKGTNIFNFTTFAISMNEMYPGLKQILPPTDCRFRTDQIKMEQGQWDDATLWKDLLENAQRERRKEYVKDFEEHLKVNAPPGREGEPQNIGEAYWRPRWFARRIEPDTNEDHWEFLGTYWEEREKRVKGAQWPEYVIDVFKVPGK